MFSVVSYCDCSVQLQGRGILENKVYLQLSQMIPMYDVCVCVNCLEIIMLSKGQHFSVVVIVLHYFCL